MKRKPARSESASVGAEESGCWSRFSTFGASAVFLSEAGRNKSMFPLSAVNLSGLLATSQALQMRGGARTCACVHGKMGHAARNPRAMCYGFHLGAHCQVRQHQLLGNVCECRGEEEEAAASGKPKTKHSRSPKEVGIFCSASQFPSV